MRRGVWKLQLVLATAALACVTAATTASAVTPAVASTTNRPPSTALVDPADTPGPLDLRTVHVTQNLGQIRWAFKTSRNFRLVDMSAGSAARTACLSIGPRGMPKKLAKLCITGTSAKKKALYRSAANPGGSPRAGFVAATITRLDRSQMTVSFAASAVGLTPPKRASFAVSTVWRGTTACPTATPCRDKAPARGNAAFHTEAYRATGCVPRGASYRFNGPAANHAMALTFDDGPSAYTSGVLSVLKLYGVHATFFEVGQQVAARPSASRAVLAAGNAIGDHSWSHPILNAGNVNSQMSQTRAEIQRVTGYTPCTARVPYGIGPAPVIAAIRNLGMLTIQWDIDPRDWSRPGAAAIARNVLQDAHNGAIAIMHDGGGPRDQTIAALHTIIPRLLARGYRLVTVPQLLGLATRYTYIR